jgi:hypothetical protein
MRCEAWTWYYEPFRCGGKLTNPMRCDHLEAESLHQLDSGVCVYVVKSPEGNTMIVDQFSHGVVGDSLEQVREDVAGAEQSAIAKQLAEGLEHYKVAKLITVGRWWELMDRPGPVEG